VKPPIRSRGGPGVHFRNRKTSEGDSRAWNISGDDTIVQKGVRRQIPGRTVFSFDRVFPEPSTTQQVYDSLVQPMVSKVTTGQNGTILCYGQTSSGKTYTMQGEVTPKKEDGIIQMAASALFRQVEEKSPERDFTVSVSYIEIYNEKVRDLLSSTNDDDNNSRASKTSSSTAPHSNTLTTLGIRQDPKLGGVSVDCNEWQVHNAADIVRALETGSKKRATSPTFLNYQSSRSHAIFRIKVESREKTPNEGKYACGGVLRVSCLNLVDLAGSEKSDTGGSRQLEGGKINQSLLSLSQVINALSMPLEKRPAYINYRNSKLTRILQPFLSGNALITVLCCITPSRLYVEETRSTLKFASRAKLITTRPILNEVLDDTAMIKRLESELEKARRDIERLEKREETTEQETKEAMEELEKLKSMIFGTKALPEFQTPPPTRQIVVVSPQENTAMVNKAQDLPTVKEIEVSMTSDTTGTDSHSASQKSDYGPKITYTVQSPAPNKSTRHISPPSEVVILKEAMPSPLRDENPIMADRSELLDARQRAEFLGAKLDATEDLVESLFKDVESARGCIHQLVFRNITLAKLKHNLERKLQELADARDERMIQQYTLLKFAMYIGLLFFLHGSHELYFAAVIFVWLTLEVVT
jgi:centromeric protein E